MRSGEPWLCICGFSNRSSTSTELDAGGINCSKQYKPSGSAVMEYLLCDVSSFVVPPGFS